MSRHFECDLQKMPKLYQGKVRTLYEIGDEKHCLMITSDRISAFDRILPSEIPGKGVLLNQMSKYWFEKTAHIIKNHYVYDDYPHISIWENDDYPNLIDRATIIRKAERIPIEAIVRSHLAGSAWKSYQTTQSICGIKLKNGLAESEKLSEPIFTPSTKSAYGTKDVNISFDEMSDAIGSKLAHEIRDVSLQLFDFVYTRALQQGIIIADTKFEFGLIDGELALIDELFTCDSSRFWPMHTYTLGSQTYCLDKDIIRNHIEGCGSYSNEQYRPLTNDIISQTQKGYRLAANTLYIPTYENSFTLGIC